MSVSSYDYTAEPGFAPGAPRDAEAPGRAAPSLMTALVAVLLRRRRGIARALLLAVVAVATAVVLRPRTYTSAMSLTSQGRSKASSVAGLAAQFGFNVSALSGEGSATPQFYVDLVKSDGFLRRIVREPLDSARALGLASASIPDLLRTPPDAPAARVERAVKRLRAAMNAAVSVRTGVIDLSVRTRDPRLSYALTRQIFQELDRYNQELRTAQAAQERRFSQERVNALREELNLADARLAAFLRENREFRGSPELTNRFDALQRDVTLRASVLSVAQQSMEQARMDELRDTPVVTPLTLPIVPPIPDPRRLVLYVGVAGVAGLVLALVLSLPAAGRALEGHASGEELEAEVRGELRTLRRRPWTLLVR